MDQADEALQVQEEEQQAQKVKRQRRRASRKQAKKGVVVSARRKMARARAVLVPGTGRVFINGRDVNTITNKYFKSIVTEPIELSKITKDLAKNVDIKVNVYGGGISGQLQAARSAIAKALVESSKDEVVKKLYLDYDRFLLIDDIRQVEPKKFKGPKARARFQKSYR